MPVDVHKFNLLLLEPKEAIKSHRGTEWVEWKQVVGHISMLIGHGGRHRVIKSEHSLYSCCSVCSGITYNFISGVITAFNVMTPKVVGA